MNTRRLFIVTLAAFGIPAVSHAAAMVPPAWPSLVSYLSTAPATSGYTPIVDPSPAGTRAALDSLPVLSTPATASFVPEPPQPASLYLFGITLFLSSWFLTRMMRPEQTSEDGSKEDES